MSYCSALQLEEEAEGYDHPHFRKRILCPFMDGCDDRLELAEIRSHCWLKHRNAAFRNLFSCEHMRLGVTNVVILTKHKVDFIIYFFVYKDEFRINVFSVNPFRSSFTFNVKLFKDQELMLNSNYAVLAFQPDLHCSRCLFGAEYNAAKCHVGIDRRSGISGFPEIDRRVLAQLQPESKFKCEIDIDEEVPSQDLPPLWYSRLADNLCKMYTCFICRDLMGRKIYVCEECDQNTCERCVHSIKKSDDNNLPPKCPHCRTPFSEKRNKQMEQYAAKFILLCRRCCNYAYPLPELDIHEEYCPFSGPDGI